MAGEKSEAGQRVAETIESTFHRFRVQFGRDPDIADVVADLLPRVRMEILLAQLVGVQTPQAQRQQRVREIIAELALLEFQSKIERSSES
ncbi:MAG: hypothetical protein ABSE45_15080 [Candidatus Acidiferrales bacterium]